MPSSVLSISNSTVVEDVVEDVVVVVKVVVVVVIIALLNLKFLTGLAGRFVGLGG